MNKLNALLLVLLFFVGTVNAQTRDRSEWIDFGSNHATKWLQYAPGKMGPNALLVPRMDYARVKTEQEIEVGAHYHQMTGDTSINSFFRYNWVLAPGRASVEIWGQPSETYRMTNEVRDDRQIYYDDEGWSTEPGDLLISTYVQIWKDLRFVPDFSICYSLKTTTGDDYNARFTDASMNYFYVAFGKSFYFDGGIVDEIRLAGFYGFYVWQVNKVEMAQDEGPVFETGIHLRKDGLNLYGEFGGYKGYDAYDFMNRHSGYNIIPSNDPLIVRIRAEYALERFDVTAEYQHGFRDYQYETFRLGLIYRLAPREWKNAD